MSSTSLRVPRVSSNITEPSLPYMATLLAIETHEESIKADNLVRSALVWTIRFTNYSITCLTLVETAALGLRVHM